MTVKQVCAYLNVKKSTVYEWIKKGEISSIRKGKRFIRFRKSTIDEWLNAHENSCEKMIEILGSIQ